jgi:FkbM family methyltransferase
MTIAHTIRLLARKVGVELNWYKPAQSQHARLFRLLAHHGIETVLDVGANNGGFGSSLREGGFAGDILSFEPLAEAHRELTARTAGDTRWHVAPRMALGADDGDIEINVAGNSTSSSILPMRELHAQAAPASRYTGVERVPLRRVDGLSHPVLARNSVMLLKIDAQGYEMPVLQGAASLLPRIHGIQLELSLAPLYESQTLYMEMMHWLTAHGFALWNVIPGFTDPTSGRMLQMDGIFFRTPANAE